MSNQQLNPGTVKAPGTIKIMGQASAYRTLKEQLTKWKGKPALQTVGFVSSGASKQADTKQQQVITNGLAAPTTSRHGWGTEYDVGTGTDNLHFEKGGNDYDKFRWLQENAWRYGFFRPFKGADAVNGDAMLHAKDEGKTFISVPEEKWHWSYYPVSQAFWEMLTRHWVQHEERVKKVLEELFPTPIERDRKGEPVLDTEGKPKQLRNSTGKLMRDDRISWVEQNLRLLHEGINVELEGA